MLRPASPRSPRSWGHRPALLTLAPQLSGYSDFFFSHSPTNLASSCFLFSYRPLDVTSRTVPDLAAHVQRKSLAQNHDASRMCAQVSEPIVHAARRSLRFRSPLPSFLRPSLLVTHTPDAHTVFDPPDGPLPFLPPPRSRKSFSAAWKPLR